MKEIKKNLYQFSVYIPPMDFTIHQYLYASDPAILFAAGTVQQAESILPDVQEILGNRPLKYIFVSHMESDEAGGVGIFQKAFPEVTVLCSHLAARELPGFGYKGKIQAEKDGDILQDGDLSLRFISYPAEVHLQDGLVCLEETSGIFYSADLMLRFGNGVGQTISGDWKEEVQLIDRERVIDQEKREKLTGELMTVKPSFAAVGHGFCIDLQ